MAPAADHEGGGDALRSRQAESALAASENGSGGSGGSGDDDGDWPR